MPFCDGPQPNPCLLSLHNCFLGGFGIFAKLFAFACKVGDDNIAVYDGL